MSQVDTDEAIKRVEENLGKIRRAFDDARRAYGEDQARIHDLEESLRRWRDTEAVLTDLLAVIEDVDRGITTFPELLTIARGKRHDQT